MTLVTLPEDVGQRIDKFITEKVAELTRSSIQQLCENSAVLVREKSVSKNYKIRLNDSILILLPEIQEIDVLPENIPIVVVYEDNDLLVINKSKNMVVHPAPGHYSGTLVNALLYHCKDSLSGINGVARPGIVHRIDKNTSGLLVVAKNDIAHIGLAEQIREHSFVRKYSGVVHGRVKQEQGTIDFPIGRQRTDRKKMCVTTNNSKNAVTHFELLKHYKKFSHLEVRLETGRTHQIRVHMAYMGYPIAGDDVYGYKNVIKKLEGQCLHAQTLGFIHPRTKEYMEFTSELPAYFTDFLKSIEQED
ncbi:MAG: RluA family pseudouridine synthase [Oscillospiraceae bacterium]